MLGKRPRLWPNIQQHCFCWLGSSIPTSTRRWPNERLMLAHCLRRWPNINLSFGQRLLFAGIQTIRYVPLQVDLWMSQSVPLLYFSPLQPPPPPPPTEKVSFTRCSVDPRFCWCANWTFIRAVFCWLVKELKKRRYDINYVNQSLYHFIKIILFSSVKRI